MKLIKNESHRIFGSCRSLHQNKVCTYVLYSSLCDIIFATIITVRTSTRGPSMNNWLMPINSNFSKTFYKYILPIKMLMQISIYLIWVWYFLISRIPNFRLDTPCTDICFQFWQKLFFCTHHTHWSMDAKNPKLFWPNSK